MKILSLSLNATHLVGIVFSNNMLLARFECSLSSYNPQFFAKLDLDLTQMLICFLLPEHLTLYKENTFLKAPKGALKKIANFYQKSLFPFNENEAYFISSAKKEKKSLHLQTSVAMTQGTLKALEELKLLGVEPDYIGSWQTAFHRSLNFILAKPFSGLFFYLKEDKIFILHADHSKILFSSILKNAPHHSGSLESALKSLKAQIVDENVNSVVIGHQKSAQEAIFKTFNQASVDEALNHHQEDLLLLGMALCAQKNSFNLLNPSWQTKAKKTWFIPCIKKLSLVNGAVTLLALGLTAISLLTQSYTLKKDIMLIEGPSTHLDTSHKSLIEKTQNLQALTSLNKYVPELPTPAEVIAFFSTHQILNTIDKASGTSPSCQEMSYTVLDLATLKVSLDCHFPTVQLKQAFEKELKLKKITFTTSTNAHLSHYEFIFKKGYSF